MATVNPNLTKEWNYTLNEDLSPCEVLPNSDKKVWWKCSKNHIWQASIASRTRGTGCPTCNSERRTSFPEYALMYYLKKCGYDIIHTYQGYGYELDIYIPSKRGAIEYDGIFWHKNRTKKDMEKNLKCKQNGITLYQIREGLPSLSDSSIDYIVQKNQKNLTKIIQELLNAITGITIDINLDRDFIAIENLRVFTEKEESLLFTNSELANQWSHERNGSLKPEHFTSNSGRKVWWRCHSGHKWQATIHNRNKGSDCPYCANQKILPGYNDLSSQSPILANEWDKELNGTLSIKHVGVNSHKQVYWVCNKGHKWKATIKDRNQGSGARFALIEKCFRDTHKGFSW